MAAVEQIKKQDVAEIKALLRQIVNNTKPVGRARGVLEWIGLIVTIGGSLAMVQEIIRFFRG
jgi:hypothetical protein